MTFQSVLIDERAQLDKTLRSILSEKIQYTTHPLLKDHYQVLQDYIAPKEGEAKRIRPMLVFHTYDAFCNRKQQPIPPDVVLRIACTVELLHNASLIHDDIIDNDAFRRGLPAFHTRYTNSFLKNPSKKTNPPPEKRAADFGRNMGILGGDHMYFIGLEVLWKLPLDAQIRIKLVEIYEQAFDGILEGVVLEEHLENAPDISQADYLFMIQMKTAQLLTKSAEMGLALAGVSKEIQSKMIQFITKLGMAFQIQDDILGTFGDGSHKPADSDIIEGKKTVLLTFALATANKTQLSVLQKNLGNPDVSPEEVQQVREVFQQTGALEKSKTLLKKLAGEAKEILHSVQPSMSDSGRDFFTNFFDYIIKRTY